MMKLEEQMAHVLDRMVITDGSWSRTVNYWDWGSGVGLFGVVEAHRVTQDKLYLDFLQKWYDENIENRRITTVNCVIPCQGLLYLYKETKNDFYKSVLDSYEKWCTEDCVKTPNGAIAHIWSEVEIGDCVNQIWADTIFMAVMFMFDYGIYKQDRNLIEKAFKQLDLHIDNLVDPITGLFYHGFQCVNKELMGQIWGRGTGWVFAALSRLIPLLEENGYDMSKYRKVFIKGMESAYSLQTENGMLRTLVTNNESYKEMTASMLFGYAGINGVKYNILPDKFIDWANKIEKAIEYEDGGWIKYMSAGTNPQGVEGYLNRPYIESNYGHGIALMFFSRLLEWRNNN